MIKLARYNHLPPRPEYIAKVRSVLANHSPIGEKILINRSRLTKTQTLCALEHLLDLGEAEICIIDGAKRYKLK